MKIKEIGHVAFFCADLERSIAFYRDKLGFTNKFCITYDEQLENSLKKKNEGENVGEGWLNLLRANQGKVWIAYFDIGNGQFFELFDSQGATEYCVPDGAHLNYHHLSLVVDDIHEACKVLKEKGVPIDTEPTLGVENTWQMWAHDPDGNKLEFMQYTPSSWHIVGR